VTEKARACMAVLLVAGDNRLTSAQLMIVLLILKKVGWTEAKYFTFEYDPKEALLKSSDVNEGIREMFRLNWVDVVPDNSGATVPIPAPWVYQAKPLPGHFGTMDEPFISITMLLSEAREALPTLGTMAITDSRIEFGKAVMELLLNGSLDDRRRSFAAHHLKRLGLLTKASNQVLVARIPEAMRGTVGDVELEVLRETADRRLRTDESKSSEEWVSELVSLLGQCASAVTPEEQVRARIMLAVSAILAAEEIMDPELETRH
jgi:hypothetical protein